MIFLPRQARDKHRENSKKRPFSYRTHSGVNILFAQLTSQHIGVPRGLPRVTVTQPLRSAWPAVQRDSVRQAHGDVTLNLNELSGSKSRQENIHKAPVGTPEIGLSSISRARFVSLASGF